MLKSCKILVVEEDFLVALDLQRMLESIGAGNILFCRAPTEARELYSDWRTLGLAMVATRPADVSALNLVSDLKAAGVPVLVTLRDGGARLQIAQRLDVEAIVHPISEEDLSAAITRTGPRQG